MDVQSATCLGTYAYQNMNALIGDRKKGSNLERRKIHLQTFVIRPDKWPIWVLQGVNYIEEAIRGKQAADSGRVTHGFKISGFCRHNLGSRLVQIPVAGDISHCSAKISLRWRSYRQFHIKFVQRNSETLKKKTSEFELRQCFKLNSQTQNDFGQRPWTNPEP